MYVVCISVSRDNTKITRKEMSKFFFGKMRIFEEMILSVPQEKMMDFVYCEEDLRGISNKILLWQC